MMVRMPLLLALALGGLGACRTVNLPASSLRSDNLVGSGGSNIAVLTQHNDVSRTGANLVETLLTPATVNKNTFGKLFSRSVKGRIFAQPLYVPQVNINGVPKNVVYVATMHNMVYAFDADDLAADSQPLWVVSTDRFGAPLSYKLFTNPADGILCVDVGPEVGITSTPVIDQATHTMYVVAKADATGAADHSGIGFWIHALDLSTGAEKQVAKKIEASAPGTAALGSGVSAITVNFEPFWQLNRPALLLTAGKLVIAFGSTCDAAMWHGWILSYDATTLDQKGVFITTPNVKPSNGVKGAFTQDKIPVIGGMGGVWQGGMGLAADEEAVYAMVGNGDVGLVDASGKGDVDYGKNFGNSFVKLSIDTLDVMDWFTPYNAAWMNLRDFDLGASGAMLLPKAVSSKPLLVGGGKQGTLYVLDRSNMGKLKLDNAMNTLNAPWDDHVNMQEDSQIPAKFEVTTERHGNGFFNIHGSPVFWQSPSGPTIYVWAEEDHLKAYLFDSAKGKFGNLAGLEGVAAATDDYQSYMHGMPGGMLSLSASGDKNGIIWATHLGDHENTHKLLLEGFVAAFAADPSSGRLVELWNSNMVPDRDHSGSPGKFAPPTIANGQVFVASNGYDYAEKDYLTDDHSLLQVYGLLPNRPTTPVTTPPPSLPRP